MVTLIYVPHINHTHRKQHDSLIAGLCVSPNGLKIQIGKNIDKMEIHIYP